MEEIITINKKVLEDSKTLKLFLFVKKEFPESVGIREALRSTKMRSSNTVSRHFIRLEEAGLVEKLKSNRFVLTNSGEAIQTVDVTTTIKAKIIKGSLITNNVFKASFLFTMTILTLILVFFSPIAASVNGIVGLLAHGVISLIGYRSERKKLRIYENTEDN